MGSGCGAEEGGGGGGTEKRARSWASVSRRSEVMSWFARRAFVKILGGGKLGLLVEVRSGVGKGEDVREGVDAFAGVGDVVEVRGE